MCTKMTLIKVLCVVPFRPWLSPAQILSKSRNVETSTYSFIPRSAPDCGSDQKKKTPRPSQDGVPPRQKPPLTEAQRERARRREQEAERKQALRAQWLSALKKYIGIPYHKRYVEQGVYCGDTEDPKKTDDWKHGVTSRIFGLDCCALIQVGHFPQAHDLRWPLSKSVF